MKINPASLSGILLIMALTGYFESSCQETHSYASGIIITQNRDTLRCLVQNSLSYNSEIPIQLNGKSILFPVDSIQYMTHSDLWFERIVYTHKKKKYQKLMKILMLGAINLYAEIPLDLSHHIDLKYYAKKNGLVQPLSDGNYKKGMATLIADSPPTTEFFIRTKYKIEKIFEVVDYYNLLKSGN